MLLHWLLSSYQLPCLLFKASLECSQMPTCGIEQKYPCAASPAPCHWQGMAVAEHIMSLIVSNIILTRLTTLLVMPFSPGS
jgi:hypothetical protein